MLLGPYPSCHRWLAGFVALTLVLATSLVRAQTDPERVRALERASAAVLGLEVRAVEGAHSAATLGAVRQGSGVLIGNDGLVLTIGYLVLEAESIELVHDDGRRIPARRLAYDLATGFGLVQALAPLKLEPVPLGDSNALADDETLVAASGGAQGALTLTQLLSRRDFSGYWEYHIEGALFTSPPRGDHSGAALFNARGELVGIGSLVLPNAAAAGQAPRPGNMFVPLALLKPVLQELRERGASSASTRAWLGLNCIEFQDQVRVLRVSDDSPAERAGLRAGDRIVGIDGTTVAALAPLWKALWAGGGPERAVRLDIERGGRAQTVVLQSVDRAQVLRRPRGI
ncbi:MAG: S1C family serine protease [Rubrivivax sp.]|nr:S1C family serine protease [Rubrivivax sp.]MDP3222044.1 S1C family serine protease [Rubrivivax sp.]